MIRKLFLKAQLLLRPFKKGDVLMGDCCDFRISSVLEQCMHRLCKINGDPICTYWCGNDTYRLTVILTVMPYYVLEAEVLTRMIDEKGEFVWMKRSLDRRIPKEKIRDMILTGKLRRQK